MALDNLQIDYLIDPAFQIENLAGKPAVGGHCEVFEAGTDTKVITYQDFDGTENPFKIPLHADGRAVILADPSKSYDIYVYDSFNNLMFSRLNVTPNLSGNINITGSDVVIYNTDGTLDITQQSIQNNVRRYEINTKHKSFGVQEPLYFIEDSDSATIIGCRSQSGDYATTAYVEKVISGKLDISSYSSQSGNFLTDKFEYDNSNHITAYNNSAFAGAEYEAGDNIDITNNRISVTGLPTDSDVQNAISSAVTNVEHNFEYNDNNFITAYNNSAFAGKEYSAGDYVDITNDTISVTGLQPSGDYATHDDLTAYATTSLVSSVSADITASIPTGDYLTKASADTLYYGIDNPSGFITGVDLSDYATTVEVAEKLDTTAFSEASGNFYTTDNPSGFITGVDLSPYQTTADMTAYATTSLVSSVSAEITAAITTGDYLTKASADDLYYPLTSNPSGYLTAHQSLDGYLTKNSADTLYYGSDNPSGFITGVDLTPYQTTADMTAYATVETLTSKQDAGNYYSASNPSGFITNDAITGLQPSGDYVTRDEMTAYQPSGDYATHDDLTAYATTALVSSVSAELYNAVSGDYELVAGSGIELVDDPNAKTTTINVTAQGVNAEVEAEVIAHSANWNSVTAKLDTTAFSNVSGDFLTAHQDLSNYATTAELAGKQDAGDYYSASNPSGFLTAVPTGTLNESAFGYDASNNITAYNGSAFAGQGGVTGNYVSGVNVITSAHKYDPTYYTTTATTISGDVVVTTAEVMGDYTGATASYSLTAIGNALNSKLNSNYITDSTTIKNINSHAEMMGSAYRQSGFNTVSADFVNITEYGTDIWFDATNLYSGIITVETTSTGSMPNGWTLQSFDNNSAVLVKQYPFGSDDHVSFMYGWSITNCEASATTYNGFELAKLAFKDEVPSGGSDLDFDYDSDGEISGINGSAIAANVEGANLFLQEPLYTSQINGSAYIGIGKYTDITELWTGSQAANSTAILSEPFYNFKYIMAIGNSGINGRGIWTQVIDTDKYRIMSAWQEDLYFMAQSQHPSNVGETNTYFGKLRGNSAITRAGYYVKENGWGYSTGETINGISGLIRISE